MADKLSKNAISRLTKVHPDSVKRIMGMQFSMTLDEFNDALKENYDNIRSELSKKDTYTKTEIEALFGCSLRSGMARSHSTNSLVLISDTDSKNRLYGDYWDGDKLYYTGMGTSGDQSLEFQQNKTLNESRSIDIFLALFSKYTIDGNIIYVYRGEPVLLDDPFPETEDGRIVYRFPLGFDREVKHTKPEVIEAIEEDKEKAVPRVFKSLSPEEQRRRAFAKSSKGKRVSASDKPKKPKSPYKRSPEVKSYALSRAQGKCECCGEKAPFEVDGEPYLVCHHIKWLEKGGGDSPLNTCGICPNCHDKIHILDLAEDTQKIVDNVKKDEKTYSGEDIVLEIEK